MIVSTAGGRVRGARRRGAYRFAGIPYAPGPAGPVRFARPGPPPAWDGIRDATRPGPTAPMAVRDFGKLSLRTMLGEGWAPGTDYLTVTITTPDPSAGGLPVLVFLHGGGFTAGTGQAELYDGTSFARDGVVLVTLNYRLGVTGWLDLPGAPANRGLLDVIAALEWTAANIEAFGGDPGNVTLAGQSAGAMMVDVLLATARARGLFRRAISQSGSGYCAFSPEQAALAAQAVAGALGVPPTVAAFSEIDDRDLVGVLSGLKPIDHAAHGFRDISLGTSPCKPVVDGELLEGQPADIIRIGQATGVDLLIGTNAEEANLYSVPFDTNQLIGERQLLAAAKRRFDDPEAQLTGYRNRFPGASPGRLATLLTTDAFTASSRALADAHASHTANRTFAYEFAWRSQAFGGALGSCHCVELPFVFDRTDLTELHGEHALLGPVPPAPEVATRTHAAWTAFVTTGDPGWEQYNGTGAPTMRITEQTTASELACAEQV